MYFNFIFLSPFMDHLPTALALCIVPFILGWLAAMAFYKVGALKQRNRELTETNAELTTKNDKLTSDNTDLRVKISQMEAELEEKGDRLRKAQNDLVICEAERNVFKGKLQEAGVAIDGGATSPAERSGAAVSFAGKKFKENDLKIVEGIGPKIEELLHQAGITTWQALAATDPDRIREILETAGSQFNMHDPGTWPGQAGLAASGQWEALKNLQDELQGGK